MSIFDPEKGLKGFIVNHDPLTDLQLKRLLMIFDEVNVSPPSDSLFFLEQGAICYHYEQEGNRISLNSLNGFEMMERFKSAPAPQADTNTLTVASILNYGGSIDKKQKPYQAILMSDILKLYEGEENRKLEEKTLEIFEKAIERKNLNVVDYKTSDFYQRNALSLKIAYDFDVSDINSAYHLKALFKKGGKIEEDRFIPSPPLPEMSNTNIFPKPQYQSFLTSKSDIDNDFEKQYFSIVAKVNKKLAISSEYNLMPIFINNSLYDFYRYKIHKVKNSSDLDLTNEWKQRYNYDMVNLNNLLFQSSSVYVSDEILKNITIQQILSYKERSIDELYKLRYSLSGEIENLTKTEIKNLNMAEIQNLIENKLRPDLLKYQNKQNEIFSKSINKTIKYSVAVGSAYLGFVQGLSPLLTAILSGVSPNLVDDGLALINKFREDKKKKYENTFSYYLNLSKPK